MARIFKGWRTSLVVYVQCRQVVVIPSAGRIVGMMDGQTKRHMSEWPRWKSCSDENWAITNIDQFIYEQNVPLFTISTRLMARIFHWLKISPVVFGDQMRKDGLNDNGTNKRTLCQNNPAANALMQMDWLKILLYVQNVQLFPKVKQANLAINFLRLQL